MEKNFSKRSLSEEKKMMLMIGLLKRRRSERLDELASQTYGTNKKIK